MQKDDSVYLRHILEAINTIGEYLTYIYYEKFSRARLLYRTTCPSEKNNRETSS